MSRAPVAIVLALAGLLGTPAAGSAGTLAPAGRWLKDSHGRVVIIHGLQVAHKKPPYHPPPHSFGQADGRNIARWGFNAVRLAWFWKGVEPRRGQIDRRYVGEIAREGRVLSSHRLYTLLEAHQDIYNEKVHGAGFPDWATLTDGVPVQPGTPGVDSFGPASERAFDNLYANRNGTADAFARAWTVMAGAFRRNPRMLGYDLFNEPYPGTQTPTCQQPAGCPLFDRTSLQAIQDRLAVAVRGADPRPIVFYEPHVYFDFGAASYLDRPPAAAGPAGFAFHDYCLAGLAGPPDHESSSPGYASCPTADERVMDNATATAARMAVPPLFDEFGDTQDLAQIRRIVDLADSHLMSWIYWGYKDWVDVPGGLGSGALFDDSDDNATLRRAKLAVLSEPYPQATAGTPLEFRFDPRTRTMTYTYAPAASVRAPTVVFAAPLQYPTGYRATVRGARILSRPGAARLRIANRPGARRVSVELTPRRA